MGNISKYIAMIITNISSLIRKEIQLECNMLKMFGLLLLLSVTTILCACSNDRTVTVEDLIHHRFIVTKINNTKIYSAQSPYIEFGENMTITGTMCNDFNGQFILDNKQITGSIILKKTKTCSNEKLNELDPLLTQLLQNGATITLLKEPNRSLLILTDSINTLTFELNDWM